MDNYTQLIGTLGFPIIACISMAIYVNEQTNNNREDVKELNEQHSKEMLEFKEEIKTALNNNTIALTKLCEKLDERR